MYRSTHQLPMASFGKIKDNVLVIWIIGGAMRLLAVRLHKYATIVTLAEASAM
jgi:hypothetical protein